MGDAGRAGEREAAPVGGAHGPPLRYRRADPAVLLRDRGAAGHRLQPARPGCAAPRVAEPRAEGQRLVWPERQDQVARHLGKVGANEPAEYWQHQFWLSYGTSPIAAHPAHSRRKSVYRRAS